MIIFYIDAIMRLFLTNFYFFIHFKEELRTLRYIESRMTGPCVKSTAPAVGRGEGPLSTKSS